MKFVFCPQCGEKLGLEEIGDEGMMPYCPQCRVPYFDWFGQCIISAVINELGEIALLKEKPASNTHWGLVAGHIKKGETLEEAVIREVREETGQEVEKTRYLASYFFAKKGLLMIGFRCEVKKRELNRSREIGQAGWYSIEKAGEMLRDGTIARQLLYRIKNAG